MSAFRLERASEGARPPGPRASSAWVGPKRTKRRSACGSSVRRQPGAAGRERASLGGPSSGSQAHTRGGEGPNAPRDKSACGPDPEPRN